MHFAAVALLLVGIYRLTRLLVIDEFPPTEWFRHRVERRFGVESSWAYLVNCPWCASFYVGGVLVAGFDWLTDYDLPVPFLLWVTGSAVTGLIVSIESAMER